MVVKAWMNAIAVCFLAEAARSQSSAISWLMCRNGGCIRNCLGRVDDICDRSYRFVELPPTLRSENAETFQVHSSFACHYSPVLRAAFNSDFIEGQTQTYKLDEPERVVLQLLIHWFYTQTIKLDDYKVKFNPLTSKQFHDTRRKGNLESIALVKLWILSDKLLLKRLQNMVVDKLEEILLSARLTPTMVFHYVWEHTSAHSLLRNTSPISVQDWGPLPTTIAQSDFPVDAPRYPHRSL